jgi:hypothetical protein
MEMRVVVPDGASVGALAHRLTAVFGGERVSLWPDSREVDVRVEGESDRAVLRVLDAVERWLDQAGIGSAEMWLGEHSYRVARWARPDSLFASSTKTQTKE